MAGERRQVASTHHRGSRQNAAESRGETTLRRSLDIFVCLPCILFRFGLSQVMRIYVYGCFEYGITVGLAVACRTKYKSEVRSRNQFETKLRLSFSFAPL